MASINAEAESKSAATKVTAPSVPLTTNRNRVPTPSPQILKSARLIILK